MTPDDLVGFARVVGLDLSPDGRTVVACVERVVPGENRFATDLIEVPARGGSPERLLTHAPGDDCDPRFSPDGRWIGFLSDRGGSSQVFVLLAEGGEAAAATRHAESIDAFAWAADGRSIFFTAVAPRTADEIARRKAGDDAYLLGSEWRPHRLWQVAAPGLPGSGDPASGDGSVGRDAKPLLGDVDLHVVDRPAVSPDGRRVAFVAQPTPEADASEEATLRILDLATGTLSEVPGSRRGATPVWGRGVSDGVLLFTRPFDGAGWSRADLFSWKPGDAAPPRDRSAGLDRDIEQVFIAPDGSIEATWSRAANTELGVLGDAGVRPVFRPGYPFATVVSAADGRLFVRGDRPDEIWFADRRGAVRPITRLNADRTSALDLPPIETVRWKSGSREVEGVLTRPATAARGGAAPLLVRPHGGPRAHSLREFSAQNAWFAALGYLVLEPNFRGSTGYGDAFAKGNARDWGAGPFADVMAGVDALIASGSADPKRLYLFGWSYGGIMANWAATHGDRFRAIVSGAGVADLRMQYILSDARRWRFDYFGGSPFLPEHLPTYLANSPVSAVSKPTTPVLFIQGEADRRCPLPQALMMHRALLDAGGTSTLMIFPREGHLFREPVHIVDRARAIARFLAGYGGAPVPAGRD